jgi:hypothetical protein
MQTGAYHCQPEQVLHSCFTYQTAMLAPSKWAIILHACVQDGLGDVEAIGERIRAAFRDLESRCAKVSQIGARIGDRLQVGWQQILVSCPTLGLAVS